MDNYLLILRKYFVLILIEAVFDFIWVYLSPVLLANLDEDAFISAYPITRYSYILIKIVIIALLYFDFKKEKLSYYWLIALVTLFYPVLGVAAFSILLLEKHKRINSA